MNIAELPQGVYTAITPTLAGAGIMPFDDVLQRIQEKAAVDGWEVDTTDLLYVVRGPDGACVFMQRVHKA